MSELIEGVNWLAVLVGFVASYLLGWLWYSPKMFGLAWAKGVGVSFEGECEMPVFAMFIQAGGTFCLAWLVGIAARSDALLTVVLIFVTVILLIASNGKYAQKSNTAVVIEASYIFVMGIVMMICQGIF